VESTENVRTTAGLARSSVPVEIVTISPVRAREMTLTGEMCQAPTRPAAEPHQESFAQSPATNSAAGPRDSWAGRTAGWIQLVPKRAQTGPESPIRWMTIDASIADGDMESRLRLPVLLTRVTTSPAARDNSAAPWICPD
jgi:hypothetical protein